MFDLGKSLLTMNPDEQKKMLDTATPGQRKTALEMGIGFKNQNQQQQQRQQKRDAYHDLDRLNTIVEKENDAHDFFGKGLTDWQKNVTGKRPSKDATGLKRQFDDYEHSVLSTVPKGGKRYEALSKSLPDIKKGFLQQGHQFALDKLNERSRNVLDKGLQRLAKGALGANDDKGVQAHDDAAFDLINKYVLSEAKFDEKDADAMYDKYLTYAGVDLEKARASENVDVPGAKPGFKMEDAEMYAEKDTGTMSDAGGKEEAEDADLEIPEGKDEMYDGHQYRGKVKAKFTEDKSAEEPAQNTDENNEADVNEADQLEDYLGALGQRESSGKYDIKNSEGYLGKYQMGPDALEDVGYMKDGKWTGKDGIKSEEDYLNSPEIQEKVIRDFVGKQWSYAKEKGLDKYVGKTINGIKITKSGVIAAVHLKGAGGAKPFFESNGKIDPTDGFKTPVSEYIKKMGGFNLPFTVEDKKREKKK